MMVALLIAVAELPAIAAAPPAVVSVAIEPCKSASGDEILVCGERDKRGEDRFRIDANVLAADRAKNALPPKPPADATADASTTGNSCVGPNACNEGVIPLVGMALAVAKAAALAAKGEDWRDAIRTHEDEYRLYKEAEERRRKDRGIKIGITVGNSPNDR